MLLSACLPEHAIELKAGGRRDGKKASGALLTRGGWAHTTRTAVPRTGAAPGGRGAAGRTARAGLLHGFSPGNAAPSLRAGFARA